MLTPSLERKFLSYLYKRYTARHGYGLRNLQRYVFLVTDGEFFAKEIPEIFVINGGIKKYLVLDWAKELHVKGFIDFVDNRLKFVLTESGYKKACRGSFAQFMFYLNSNPGLSIAVAVLGLITAVCAILL